MKSSWLLIPLLAVSLSSAGLAQSTARAGSASSAAHLPLSGRSAQGGSVTAVTTPAAGAGASVNTLNSNVSVQGPYGGSSNSASESPLAGGLSLKEALQRGVDYNLGAVGMTQALLQAQGQERVARSALRPNLSAAASEAVLQTNLQAMGIRVSAPGLPFPSIVGPFNYFDLRATLTQTVLDLTALNNLRASRETVRANEHSVEDARDLVVLAVGGAYLQTQAARARIESAKAQLETAKALYDQTRQRREVGLLPQLDVNRTLVQQQTQAQRLVTFENDYAKQKINLARLTGLPPSPNYDLTDDLGFSPDPPVTLEEALEQALVIRADLKAADAQLRAAERSRDAAKAERMPSLAFSADYGAIGVNPAQSHGTFTVVGTLRIPIWQGGRIAGEVQQAQAALDQRRAEREDLLSRIESDVRSAFLDIEASASQIEVAKSNQQLAEQTLDLTRQRLAEGITDTVEVVQAQEAVAAAGLDYITSLYAHNIAKLSLARAIGQADVRVAQYLGLP